MTRCLVGVYGDTGREKRFKIGEGMWAGWVLISGLGPGCYFFGSRELLKVSVIVIATTDICKHCCI